MEELMKAFNECLETWNDLPEYVYTDEYKKAFIDFANKKIEAGIEVKPILAVLTLHHEFNTVDLGGKTLPYFEFNRKGEKHEKTITRYTMNHNYSGKTIGELKNLTLDEVLQKIDVEKVSYDYMMKQFKNLIEDNELDIEASEEEFINFYITFKKDTEDPDWKEKLYLGHCEGETMLWIVKNIEDVNELNELSGITNGTVSMPTGVAPEYEIIKGSNLEDESVLER